MQVHSPPPVDESGNVTFTDGNPTGDPADEVQFPVDGIEGRGTAPFVAEPDAFGQELEFAIAWIGTSDVAGAIVSRAQGLNAELLHTIFPQKFDNTDVYRLMYLTLFGELLPSAEGQPAPDRP
jgi:alkaline phosphatase